MRICAVLLLLALIATAQKAPSDVAGIQVPAAYNVSGVSAADVNQDGLLDLVVTAVKTGAATDRFLRIYLRREGGGFTAKPDHEVALHKDFTAFLVADVLKNPGSEVVLVSGSRAVAWLPGESGREQWVSLFRCPFIIQLPKSGRMLHIPDFVHDLNGDGLPDFLMPIAKGYAVFLQKQPGVFERRPDLLLPEPKSEDADKAGQSVSMRRRSITVSLRLPEFEKARSGRTLRPNLVDSTEWTWRPRVLDFDGNGTRDLVVRGSHNLHLWLDVASSGAVAPSASYDAPVVADRSRLIDIAYSSHFLDLDGDKLTDSVMIAGDQRADEPRTQVMVFKQGGKRTTKASPLFGDKGLPSQLIVLAGFTGATDFHDVDGDGRPDLVMGSLRQDIIDKLRESARKKTEVEFYVYLNQGGTFSKSPDIRKSFEMKIEGLTALKSGFLARFIPDITGDGVSELITRTRPERLDVHYLRRVRGGGLELFDKPLWSLNISKYADLAELPPTEKEKAGVLVIERETVTMVRF